MHPDPDPQQSKRPFGPMDKGYRSHPVFATLSKYADFYESLSLSVLGFVTLGTKAICNIDSYLYSSVEGTIASINHALSQGRIGDSYALLRRYHDSAVINVYTNLYLQDNFALDNLIVAHIQGWLSGKDPIPEYRIMSKYIRQSARVAPITKLLFAHSRYSDIRDRCNSFTHYNFFSNVLLNDGRIFNPNRMRQLDQFAEDLDNLLVFHLGLIFYLNQHYMASSDYIDCLDCGLPPPENSQYFVAPFVQDIFDSVIKRRRPDIYSAIKSATSMQLE
jgi:hypothetical protein